VRYAVAANPIALLYVIPIVSTTAVVGTYVVAAVASSTLDVKRFAAASSILHLQLTVVVLC